jgi:hypothetical protein
VDCDVATSYIAGMSEKQTVQVNVRIDQENLDWYKLHAIELDRTLNYTINVALTRYKMRLMSDRDRRRKARSKAKRR